MQVSGLRKIGNSIGLTLNREILGALRAGEGDLVAVTAGPRGAVIRIVTPGQAEILRACAEEVDSWRGVLRELGDA